MGYICNAAKCAFGAYKDPRVKGLEEYTTKQNIITHLNKDRLDDYMQGVLRIQLHHCKNLRDADWIGESDPYVTFTSGDAFVKSKTIYDSLNPVWEADEIHYLFLRKQHLDAENGRCLTVQVFDEDTILSQGKFDHLRKYDPCLGTVTLEIDQLMVPGEHSVDVSLVDDKGSNNHPLPSINFTAEFISVKDALVEMGKDKSSAWSHNFALSERQIKWRELADQTGLGDIETEPVAFVDAITTGSQAWIHMNKEEKLIVVAFRGTEVLRLRDIFTDLNFRLAPLTESMLSTKYPMKPTDTLRDNRIRLHCGFRNAYESIRESILRLIYDITSWDDSWTVRVTGHSLGGALATICAFELRNRKLGGVLSGQRSFTARRAVSPTPKGGRHRKATDSPKGPRVDMVSFGAPCSGDKVFTQLYNETVGVSLRVFTRGDPVVSLLPFYYTHVKTQIVIQPDGKVGLGGLNINFRRNGKTVRRFLASLDRRDRELPAFAEETAQTNTAEADNPPEASEHHERHQEAEPEVEASSWSAFDYRNHLQPRYIDYINEAIQQLNVFHKEPIHPTTNIGTDQATTPIDLDCSDVSAHTEVEGIA